MISNAIPICGICEEIMQLASQKGSSCFVVIHAYMAIPECNHQGDVLNIVTTHLAMSLDFKQLGLTKSVGVARRSKQAWKV